MVSDQAVLSTRATVPALGLGPSTTSATWRRSRALCTGPVIERASKRTKTSRTGDPSATSFVPRPSRAVGDVLSTWASATGINVRVVTAEREHLIRLSLRELLPQLDPAVFWQVHRGTVVQARCIASARRDDSGKAFLSLHGRPETLVASRLYAHRFKGL